MQKNISVIIVGNGNLESLTKVIWGFNTQTFRNFEVIIVNLASSENDFEAIENLQQEVFFPLRCIYSHKKKSENKYMQNVLRKVSTDYVLISNSNSLPRHDFLEQHIKSRVEGVFLIGDNFVVSQNISEKISKEIIYTGKCFDSSWIKRNGFKSVFRRTILSTSGLFNNFVDWISPTTQEIKYEIFSAWKSDFLKVDNFDNNLVLQFKKNGLKPKNVKYKSMCLKLTS